MVSLTALVKVGAEQSMNTAIYASPSGSQDKIGAGSSLPCIRHKSVVGQFKSPIFLLVDRAHGVRYGLSFLTAEY